MTPEQLTTNICDYIAIPSVAPNELKALEYLESILKKTELTIKQIPVDKNRYDILAYKGSPKIIFTTHVDVVPADPDLFNPRIIEGKIYGRGACDTKAIGIMMINVCQKLLEQNETDFGILFVVGEEVNGIGARTSLDTLKELGTKCLINGEPTNRKCIVAHKGIILFDITFHGTSAHSGYPELGDDANLKLIKFCEDCTKLDLESDPTLGKPTLNFGVISGGVADNVVSPKSNVKLSIRSVSDNEKVIEKVKALLPKGVKLEVTDSSPVKCIAVPGFETTIACYCTDLSRFAPLNLKAVLFGPGSFEDAHTDHDLIDINELLESEKDYLKIYNYLKETTE